MTEELTREAEDDLVESAIDEATEAVAIQATELPDLEPTDAVGDPIGLEGILNVPVRITVQVGRTEMTLSQLVGLRPGSLVLLDRDAYEPADIVVNGRLVARGEVVTIEDKYAVRITDVA